MGLVVGIAGVSRAGKTSLATQIKEYEERLITVILPMDEFVAPEKEFPKINGVPNWEIPESVDYTKLIKSIKENKPVTDLILVEGILIYNNRVLWDLFDIRLFIDLSEKDFFKRKNQDHRWNESGWYLKHIWDSHLTHGTIHQEECKHINGAQEFDLNKITKWLNL